MATEIIINKVIITAEAKSDYEESVVCFPMPCSEIKLECEKYIDNLQDVGKPVGYYFRTKYLIESSGEMLMLFFYKGERFGLMQIWNLKGMCLADDWSEDAEDDGSIRTWLNSRIKDLPVNDWVLELCEDKRREGIGAMPCYSLSGLPKEVLHAIYSGTDKEVSEALSHIQRKGGKWVGYRRYYKNIGKARKMRKRTR